MWGEERERYLSIDVLFLCYVYSRFIGKCSTTVLHSQAIWKQICFFFFFILLFCNTTKNPLSDQDLYCSRNQRPWKRPTTLYNEHLKVKIYGLKCILYEWLYHTTASTIRFFIFCFFFLFSKFVFHFIFFWGVPSSDTLRLHGYQFSLCKSLRGLLSCFYRL